MNNKERKVLGIDCGTAIVGWAMVGERNNKLEHLASGAIKTEQGTDMFLRLKDIYAELEKIIKKYSPTEMGVEKIFFFKNKKTVISVSQAKGVIMLAGANAGLRVFEYTPLQVKSAVTGYGRAEKKQVQFMVSKILKMTDTPKLDDITDAIAVSICHLNST